MLSRGETGSVSNRTRGREDLPTGSPALPPRVLAAVLTQSSHRLPGRPSRAHSLSVDHQGTEGSQCSHHEPGRWQHGRRAHPSNSARSRDNQACARLRDLSADPGWGTLHTGVGAC